MVSTLSKQDAAFILKLAVHRGQIAVPQPETPQSPASSGSLGSASVSPTLEQGKPASLVLEMLNLKFLRPLEFSLFRILHRSLQELLKAFFFLPRISPSENKSILVYMGMDTKSS